MSSFWCGMSEDSIWWKFVMDLFWQWRSSFPNDPVNYFGPWDTPSSSLKRCLSDSSLHCKRHTNQCIVCSTWLSRAVVVPFIKSVLTFVPSHPTARSFLGSIFRSLKTFESIYLQWFSSPIFWCHMHYKGMSWFCNNDNMVLCYFLSVINTILQFILSNLYTFSTIKI